MRRCISVVLLLFVSVVSFPQSKRPITDKDLFRFQWIGDPQISPDGAKVAFVRVSVNEKKDGYDTALWMTSTNGGSNSDAPLQMLTSGKRDSQPRWSPDGKWLVFVRGSEPKDGKPVPAQLALLSMSGGEAWTITDLPRSASNPVWSPDGKRIAFLCDANAEDLAKKGKKENPEDHESDVKVITRAVYRLNGLGYLDPKHHEHIWIVDVPAGVEKKASPKQLTKGNFDESDPGFSSDGANIYFHTDQNVEPYYDVPHSEIMYVPTDGGAVQSVAKIDMGIGGLTLSPDGKRLAFRAEITQPVRSYSEPDLWVLEIGSQKPRNLTADYDFDVGSGVGGDNGAPRAGGGLRPMWTRDGSKIIDIVAKQGKAILASIDTQSGAVTELSKGDQAVEHFTATPDLGTVVTEISTPVMINELFVMSPDGSQRQITNINGPLFYELTLTQPEEIWYTSFDGKRIQAWLQKPPDFDSNKKYPLILDIHGGPHSAYGWIFDHEFQFMAAKGYVVLYPNPRGSTSYGQDFGNVIQYHYPGDDFRDLMIGVDESIKKGYIDSNKLGVTGGSGGGLLTDWTVGHTTRFKAAVAQRDISDWTAWWYSADFTLFQPSWFKAPPFNDPQDFINRSPITYIKQVKTPMMFILGDADWRTPPGSGGEQMFRALKFMRIPTVMVRFPRESHELSRSGEPWHRIERLDHITGWFDKWLMGTKKPEYNQPFEETNAVPEQKPDQQQHPADLPKQ